MSEKILKMHNREALYTLILFLLLGCNTSTNTEKHYYHGTDKIASEYSYNKKKLIGWTREFDRDGKVIFEIYVENGEGIGRTYSNGKLISEGRYVAEYDEGPEREVLVKEGEFTYFSYDSLGNLAQFSIVNQKGEWDKTGEYKAFYADSTLKEKGQYTGYQKTGRWEIYDATGILEKYQYYEEGELVKEETIR